LPILAQKLSRIGDWGGSNLDANSLQSGSVLDAIQQEVQQALRRSLLKYRLHTDQELFDKAYGYIREYY